VEGASRGRARARAPPHFDTDRPGTGAFAFDQSPSWDPIAPPDPGVCFEHAAL